MKSKLERVGYFDKETGESLTKDIVSNIEREEIKNKISEIYFCLENQELDKISLEDLELLMKLHKRSLVNVSLDFNNQKEKYFIIKSNREISKKLNPATKGFLYDVSQMITHDNTIVMDNNTPIKTYKQLCEYLNLSYNTFRHLIKKDIEEFNILRKEKIRNNYYLVLNPLFSLKSRNVTEYMFKCFYKELKAYLHPIDYLYLVKLYGLDPSLGEEELCIPNAKMNKIENDCEEELF